MKDLFGHDKVDEAIERIRMFEPKEGYYGATSFGKDSTTVMQLTQESGVKVDWHYSVTTIDPPELIYFGRKYYPNVIRERPKKPFLTRLVENGFPMFFMRWCCKEYKENGGKGRIVLTGIRQQESIKRSKRKMVEHCLTDSSKIYVNPIIDWSEGEVWEFIKSRQMPYCSLYDEGFKRIGCIMCPCNVRRLIEAERWPRFKEAFRKTFI